MPAVSAHVGTRDHDGGGVGGTAHGTQRVSVKVGVVGFVLSTIQVRTCNTMKYTQ